MTNRWLVKLAENVTVSLSKLVHFKMQNFRGFVVWLVLSYFLYVLMFNSLVLIPSEG